MFQMDVIRVGKIIWVGGCGRGKVALKWDGGG